MTRRAGTYYECSLRRMDTSAIFEERGKVRAQDGSPLPLDEYQLDDPETGKRWELNGLFVCDIDAADLRAMLNDWGDGDDAVMVSVEDNGYHGDGLWLLVSPNTRAGTPETHQVGRPRRLPRPAKDSRPAVDAEAGAHPRDGALRGGEPA